MSANEVLQRNSWRRQSKALVFGLLALLLTVDLVLIGLHVLSGRDDWTWSMENDAGYAERFQHLKWCAAAVMLLFLSIRRRALVYAAWALLFAYFAVDDSQRLHERMGSWLVGVLDLRSFEDIYLEHFPYFYLRAQEFGELIVAASLGVVVVAVLFLVWPGPDAIRDRTVTKRLVAWLVLFAVFAVGFDMLHTMVWEIHPPAIELIGAIEDGGEMICASLLVGGLALELTRA